MSKPWRRFDIFPHLIRRKEIKMKLYVGNLSYDATEAEVEEAFETFGAIESVEIIRDRYDDRPKGFGFVEMENQADAEKAMKELDGKEFMGRALKVNVARPRQDRNRGRGRGGGGGGGGRGRW
jgi:RNA recognition motif-containing protein